MRMYEFNSEPVYIIERTGEEDNPYIDIKERAYVQYEKIFLKEIPVEYYGVHVKNGEFNLVEVSTKNEVVNSNYYYVDYKQGVVHFDNLSNGYRREITYKGKGVRLYPASRIYLDSNKDTNVVETLKEIAQVGVEALEGYNSQIDDMLDEMSAKIDESITATNNTNTATANVTTAIETANTQANYAKEQGDYAKAKGDEAVTATNNANSALTNMTHLGDYSASTTYIPRNVVSYNGSSYMNTSTCTGVLPTNTSNWKLIGLKGDSFNWRGDYVGATPYVKNDVVGYQGSSYVALQATTGNLPTNTTYWSMIAQKGIGNVDSVNGKTGAVVIEPSDLTQDANYRFVTDTEKSTWNNKQSAISIAQNVIMGRKTSGTGVFESLTASDVRTILNVADGANNYSHPANHAPSIITQDENNRFVTDAEKSTWNGKQNAISIAQNTIMGRKTTGSGGFESLTASDVRTILNVADGANNYSHPASHPASIITQDENNRFVTDTEKSTWNAKASTSLATTTTDGLMPKEDKSKLNNLMNTISATLPATAGWYRIATSAVDIGRNSARFEIDWALSGHHGQVTFNAGIMYGVDPTLNQLHYSNYSANGITKARIVYHTTYTANYAYLEVYNAGANAIVVNVQLLSSLGWSLITPIAGSIPTGYTNLELSFVDGLASDNIISGNQLASRVATGTAPLTVASTTVVTNLNADMVDGAHAGTGANNVLKLDASGKAPASIITQDASNRFVSDTQLATFIKTTGNFSLAGTITFTSQLVIPTYSGADPSSASVGSIWIRTDV